MTATVILARHAAHVDLDRRLSGRRADVALSEAGYLQAARLGSALAHDGVTRIECSPLDRTRATATAIATACGLPDPVAVPALVEIDMGDWTGAAFDALHGDPAWDRWNDARGTARIPGGETMAEAQARIVGRLAAVAGPGDDGATIVMVSHSDMIKAAVAHVIGLPLDHVLRFEIGPASITRIVVGDWGMRLLSLNEKVD